MTLVLELPADLERQLEAEAARRGQPSDELARQLLAQSLSTQSSRQAHLGAEQLRDSVPEYAHLPRRSPMDVEELVTRQGASLKVDWEGMTPDFWPDDEAPDEFLNALREWRREVDTAKKERE